MRRKEDMKRNILIMMTKQEYVVWPVVIFEAYTKNFLHKLSKITLEKAEREFIRRVRVYDYQALRRTSGRLVNEASL